MEPVARIKPAASFLVNSERTNLNSFSQRLAFPFLRYVTLLFCTRDLFSGFLEYPGNS